MPYLPVIKLAKQRRAYIDSCSRAGRRALWTKLAAEEPAFYKAVCLITGESVIDLQVPDVIILKDRPRHGERRCTCTGTTLCAFWKQARQRPLTTSV